MSRLGDLILLERTRQKLTRKQVARKCGVSEKYIQDVEEDRRIILAGLETLCRYLPQRPDSSGGFPKEPFEMMDPCARKPAAPRTERRKEK